MSSIDDAEYFAAEALSASGAKLILQSPAHYKWDRDNKRSATPAMVLGTVTHTLILEPHRQDAYVVKRQNWATKEGKAERDALQATGLPIISEDDEARVLRMRDAVYKHRAATELLDEARAYEIAPESAIFWSGYQAQVACKAKPDACTHDTILDVKTCVSASHYGFERQIYAFKYHLQAAHYQAALEAETGRRKRFVFIAIEKDAPHCVSLFQIDDTALLMGAAQMQRAALVYGRCRDTDTWPGYPHEIQRIGLPNWAIDVSEFEQGDDDKEIDF